MGRVWYACYGSNLQEARFLRYIDACSDRSRPSRWEPVMLDHRMYFARHSDAWGGGVSFIEKDPTDHVRTYGKRYLVTHEQFIQVVRQENSEDAGNEDRNVDLDRLLREGALTLEWGGWYDRLIHLGDADGAPIITFTATWDPDREMKTVPSDQYLGTIANGLRATHGLSGDEMVDYFKGLDGIKDMIPPEDLARIVMEAV